MRAVWPGSKTFYPQKNAPGLDVSPGGERRILTDLRAVSISANLPL
jgi:hypothetical protein